MDIRVGAKVLEDIGVPVVWGDRAIIQDSDWRLSVVDCRSRPPRLEVLQDRPAPGVNFVPGEGDFRILPLRGEAYVYNKVDRTLISMSDDLPECHVGNDFVRIGAKTFYKAPNHRTDASLLVTADDVHLVNRLPAIVAEALGVNVPNPEIPEHTFILSGVTSTGQKLEIARGICECNTLRDLSKEFYLHNGQQWICPDCGNRYSFDNGQISIARPITGAPPDGSILAIVSKDGDSWSRQNAQELDQVVLQSARLFGAAHIFVWIANDFWKAQAPYIRFNLSLSAPGIDWKIGPEGSETDSSYVLYRADPTREPSID